MDAQPAVSRRTVLAGTTVVLGGIAGGSVLAGCGSSSSSGSGSSGSGSSGSGGGSAGGSGSGGGSALTALSSIPDGSTVSVENPQGGTVLLTRKGNTVTGLNARCTHQGCTVAPAGNVLNCPCHGSQFQPGTGAVLQGPATAPLAKVNVAVTNGQVTLA